MTKLRDGFGLGKEAGRNFGRVAKVRMNDLQGHFAPEAPIARAIHRGHPAVPDLFEGLVFGELGQPHPSRGGLHHRVRL
jgi:hypothetical protein